jgi:hypothetical protein
MKIRVIAGVAAAAAVMTAGSAAGAQAATTVPTARHASPVTACTKWARQHMFVEITKAAAARHGGETVTGYLVRVHCGGPDDLQYIPTRKIFSGHVLPRAGITVLSFNGGLHTIRISGNQLPKRIAHDESGRIFNVTGPAQAIRGLSEMYHP